MKPACGHMATSELDTSRDDVDTPDAVTPPGDTSQATRSARSLPASSEAVGVRPARPKSTRSRAVDDDASEAFQQAQANTDTVKREARRTRRAPSPARVAEREQSRVTEQPGFVLHSYPYRETSLIIDVLTRDHGRIALVAKGAKRPHSALRGVLQTFQPLSLAWLGKGELRTLTKAEWVGGLRPLEGDALLSGFYLNELLVKFCARDDPHDKLFQHYLTTLHHLAHGEPAGVILRAFERVLLRETGYAVAFDRCTQTRGKVVPDRRYVFHPDWGVRPARGDEPSDWPVVGGQTLLDMEQDDYSRAQTVQQSKLLMRFLLNHHLGGVPLNTRQILLDLQKL